MMTYIRKNDRFVRQTVEQFCCRTVWSHIRCGYKARALINIQLRVILNELVYRSKMFLQGTHGIQMYKEKRFRSSGGDMAVPLSESRKNDALIIPDLLRVFVYIFLHALFAADINKPAV